MPLGQARTAAGLQFEFGADYFVVQGMLQREAELFADAHYFAVVGQDVGG